MMNDEAEALEHAAQVAVQDGDYEHAIELRQRAQMERRRQRERNAGVRNIGCDFLERFDDSLGTHRSPEEGGS